METMEEREGRNDITGVTRDALANECQKVNKRVLWDVLLTEKTEIRWEMP
jgi:hypothetical protein